MGNASVPEPDTEYSMSLRGYGGDGKRGRLGKSFAEVVWYITLRFRAEQVFSHS